MFGTLPPSPMYVEIPFITFSKLGASKLGIIMDQDFSICENRTMSAQFSAEYDLPLYAHYTVDYTKSTYKEDIKKILKEFMDAGVDVVHGCTYINMCAPVSHLMSLLLYVYYIQHQLCL